MEENDPITFCVSIMAMIIMAIPIRMICLQTNAVTANGKNNSYMENIEVMVILFIIVVLGYTLCKLGYMGDRFDQKLSSIVIDITCPALILSSVMGKELPDRTLILPLLGVGFLTYILLLVFGFWVPRLVSKTATNKA